MTPGSLRHEQHAPIGLDGNVRAIGPEIYVELGASELDLEPYDQAILAAALVRGSRLRRNGAREVFFCELDGDLQPWDKRGNAKQPLTQMYDDAGVWVCASDHIEGQITTHYACVPLPDDCGDNPSCDCLTTTICDGQLAGGGGRCGCDTTGCFIDCVAP